MRFLILLLLACAGALHFGSAAQVAGDLRAPSLIDAADDGPHVRLVSTEVTVEPGAGLLRTTLDMTFRNPSSRVLEGRLQFPLQPGQQVVAFALDVDGRMRDAVPVEKERGRQVFEAIERRGVDPGLLEQTEGDAFRLRIFPFAPGGTRRVRIVLLEAMERRESGTAMTLPLQFAADLDRVDVLVRSASPPMVDEVPGRIDATTIHNGLHRIRVTRGGLGADGTLTVRLAAASGPRIQIQRHGQDIYFVADVPVVAAHAPRALPARMGLLWDSSMSGKQRAHQLEFQLLDAYFRQAGDVEVDLIRLRDVAAPVERHRVVAGNWRALRTALDTTVYDGGSNAGGWALDGRVGEYLLFSDGLFNTGTRLFAALNGSQRLYAIQSANGDSARLAALAEARHGRLIQLRESAALRSATTALLQDVPRLTVMDGIGVDRLTRESSLANAGRLRIAGRITAPDATVRLQLLRGGMTERIDVPLAGAVEGDLAGMVWARYSLAALQGEPEVNRAAIASIGQGFGIVTARTSLLVLEDVQDYVRYEIEPPSELRDAFDRLRAQQRVEKEQGREARLDRVARQWAERVEWWSRPFPKTQQKPAAIADTGSGRTIDSSVANRDRNAPAPASAPMEQAPAAMARVADSLDRIEVTGSRINLDGMAAAEAVAADAGDALDTAAPRATIRLQPWRPDSPTAVHLRRAATDRVYALYLLERDREPRGTAFYLDVADILLEKHQHALSLRVLSNLAELDLDNRHVLRVLAYRLLQAGHADLAVPVLERVRRMAPDEPQSHRDLALAYQATGAHQHAIDALYVVVQGEWDSRFRDVQQTALAELNAIVATSRQRLDTDAFDQRLLRNLPLGLRTVLTWDSDNSDMDLWITDPQGEKAYYGHRLTAQGGRMSDDFTGGYGPEEFGLRTPLPGVYTVQANFFGDRQALVTGATTLQLWLSTGFGTRAQVDRRVTLRLKGQGETVLVGEFEVK